LRQIYQYDQVSENIFG